MAKKSSRSLNRKKFLKGLATLLVVLICLAGIALAITFGILWGQKGGSTTTFVPVPAPSTTSTNTCTGQYCYCNETNCGCLGNDCQCLDNSRGCITGVWGSGTTA